MLSAAQIAIYATYAGDLDGWTRHATDRSAITAADWQLIDELLLGLALVQRGAASADYAQALNCRIDTVVADAAARAALYRLAGG